MHAITNNKMLHAEMLIVCLCTVLLHFTLNVLTESVELPPPSAAVYSVKNKDKGDDNFSNIFQKVVGEEPSILRKVLLNDIVNTDVEVEANKKIVLECLANNPVQWQYHGSGKPEFSTFVSIDFLNKREVHKASLIISHANEQDTGLYKCSYAEFPEIYSTYYLFVPGPEIFVAQRGRVINYSAAENYVTIPCVVSVKNAKVTLRKVYYDNSLRFLDSSLAQFNPKEGFKLNIHDLRDSDGVYVCAGVHEGHLKLREFALRNQDRNHTTVTFPDGLHQEDTNPCLSYSCPRRSVCHVNLNTNIPFCGCTKESSAAATNCIRLCKASHDCPKSEKCQFSTEKQLRMCVHVCEEHDCGENAECAVDEQRGGPKCQCKRGFHEDSGNVCTRIPLKIHDTNSYCSSTKCGPHARCQTLSGKAQCTCDIGTLGVWPDCAPACTTDDDCDLQDRCSTDKGICEHVCTENMCAPKAECKVLQRKPQCLCPPGFTGKATEACYPSHYYQSRSNFHQEAKVDEMVSASDKVDRLYMPSS